MTKAKNTNQILPEETLFRELSLLIEKSKQKVISQVKSTVNLLFWQIGKRINEEILHNKRAEYGAQIVSNLAEKLSAQFGRSFEVKSLRRMMQFAAQFPDRKIVVPLARQLSWSHIILLLPLKSLEEKLFYAQHTIEEGLGKRDLRTLIDRKTFERTQIANTQISKKSKIPPSTFKDPYMFDFLDLQGAYMVAEYWTELPPKKELQEKIRKLLLEARERLESRKLLDQK